MFPAVDCKFRYPQVVRERPRILPVVCQFIAGRMSEHVWMHSECEARCAAAALDHPQEPTSASATRLKSSLGVTNTGSPFGFTPWDGAHPVFRLIAHGDAPFAGSDVGCLHEEAAVVDENFAAPSLPSFKT